jgi:hypothetical protein
VVEVWAWVVGGEVCGGDVVDDEPGNGGLVRVVRATRLVEVVELTGVVLDVDAGELDDVVDEVITSGCPPNTGGGNCCTGVPASAASMNFFQIRAGRVPPLTCPTPSTPVRTDLSCGVLGS